MKTFLYPWVLLGLAGYIGAAPFDLELPALTYKNTDPKTARPLLAEPFPDPQAGVKTFTAVARKTLAWDRSRTQKFDLRIAVPRPGIDYKLVIVDADPSIDLAMIVPTPRLRMQAERKR